MPTKQANTKYRISPETITKMSSKVSRVLEQKAMGSMMLPLERSLAKLDKLYEYEKSDGDHTVGYEMDPTGFYDGIDTVELLDLKTPLTWVNMALSAHDVERLNKQPMKVAARLAKRIEKMALRQDLITYLGDTKYNVLPLNSATGNATEVTTALNVTTTVLAASTFATMFQQLDAADLYSGNILGSRPRIAMEFNPTIWYFMGGKKSTNEDFSVMRAIRETASEVGFEVDMRANKFIGASYEIKNGKSVLTYGSDGCLIYPRTDMVTKILQSPMTIEQSNFDDVFGTVYQPLQRHTRVDDDVGKALLLYETDVVTA